MIADLKPYPEYKESGLPWLGQVPGHWETRRLRHACEMRVSNVDKHTKKAETPVRLCNYVEVYKNERIRETARFMSASASEDERIRFRLCKGDVLITKDSEQWNDIGVPSLVEFEAPDLVCGYHLAILRSRSGLQGPFLHRALQSHFIAAQFHVEANGVTRYGLSQGAIKGVSIPLPPPSEQAAIVRFLDWANGRLERAIRAKRKVIALLNEQKQAFINRAVTRGLDPSVTLKPSGIPWLGDIPQHWEICSVKRLARPGGKTFTDGDWIEIPFITRSGVRLIQTGNIGRGHYREKGFRYISEETFKAFGCTEILPNDVLICRLDGPVGRACLAPQLGVKMITSVDNVILKVRPEVDAQYAVCLMSSSTWLDWMQSICRAGGGFRYRVSRSMLGAIQVPTPPLFEQQAIICSIEERTSPLARTMSRLEREIELLREYRTRLTSDVVTGKLDVREAAARLSVEAALDADSELASEMLDGSDNLDEAETEEDLDYA